MLDGPDLALGGAGKKTLLEAARALTHRLRPDPQQLTPAQGQLMRTFVYLSEVPRRLPRGRQRLRGVDCLRVGLG
jgi:hypothetical protein